VSRAVGALGLPPIARLRQAREIQAVFQAGRREERRAFVLLWLPGQGSGRAGFVVSRQVRGAVRRNRARRRLKEAYRAVGVGRASGVDAVFVARVWALEAPLAELKAEMARALQGVSRSLGA
jgi:ribonuclease P protein component